MKQLLITLSALCLLTTANAKVISGNTQFVKIEVTSVVLEVSAKCKSPKFEDDTFQVYFAEASYAEVSSYQKMGYAYRLLDKLCGPNDGSKPFLSTKDYETVRILLLNSNEAQDILDEAIKNAWSAAK